MKKHEWRKAEKEIYLPKSKPEFIDVPEFNFLTIEGEGNPNSKSFADHIRALYASSYGIKMGLKKMSLSNCTDYTVYPLEGVWDLNEEGRKAYNGEINKDDLVFTLMIRQPDFLDEKLANEFLVKTFEKRKEPLLKQVKFQKLQEGPSLQMLHIGSYDNEKTSFEIMHAFALENRLARKSLIHREIYLSDFRKVAEEKLKTVLRFEVETIKN